VRSDATTTTPAARTSPVEGPWDRRRRLVALEIEGIALELFAETGFDAVTVDQVAHAAGISESTFFRYFSTKDEVLFSMPRRVAARICDAVDARPEQETVLEAWRAVIADRVYDTAEDVRASRQLHRIIEQSPVVGERIAADPVPAQRNVATVAARLHTSETDLRATVLATVIRGAVAAATVAWYADPDGLDLGALMLEALDVLEGIGRR
jgi:TetR/AcrR family transcriptional regulator, regulator of mycofactocin system